VIEHGEKELKFAYENGFYSGDGCLTEQGQRIYLYGDKKNLLSKFSSVEIWKHQPNQDRQQDRQSARGNTLPERAKQISSC
jgi:hypothetical protein